MAHIEIPFREDMRQAIADGAKSCTSRNKRYGEIGDTFEVDGRAYRLTSVRRYSLGAVAARLFALEGTYSAKDFERLWVEIHPRKGWDPEQLVWTHFFEEVSAVA